MDAFKATFINEIEKMYKKKKALVIAILSFAIIALGQIAILVVRSNLGIMGSTEFPLLVLSVITSTILPLFTALTAIDVFTGEFSHNTMKIAFIRPVSRLKIFCAKISAVVFFAFSNLMLVMVLSTISGLLFKSTTFSGSSISKIIIAYIVSIFPVIILSLIVVFLSNIFRSGAGILFLSILIFLGFKVLGYIFPQISGVLFTSMLSWYDLWIADKIPYLKLIRQFLIMTGYGIMFFTAGFYLFEKKDL